MDIWTLSDLSTPWCVHVVATLRVAHHIEAGNEAIADLARAAACDRDSLQRVLRHLIKRGLFEEPEQGRFILNDAARQLLEAPLLLGLDLDNFGSRMAYAWGTLLSAVRSGKPAYHEVFGRDFWADLEANPRIAAAFDELMGPGHGTPDFNVLADPSEWKSVRTVVDVGGGTGAQLAEILKNFPDVRGTLVDLPRTVARSAEVFASAGVSDRVTVSGQSFFDPLPPGADLYVLKNVLDDWPDPEALAILKRCAEAARPLGRVVVFNGAGPGDKASPELLMLVLVGGKARTFDEFRDLAREAGLGVRGFFRQPCGRGIVDCQPT